jgi:hypothetical protein
MPEHRIAVLIPVHLLIDLADLKSDDPQINRRFVLLPIILSTLLIRIANAIERHSFSESE